MAGGSSLAKVTKEQLKKGGIMSLIKRPEWPSMGGSLLSDFFDDERFFNSPSLRGRSLPAINVKENENNYQIEEMRDRCAAPFRD